jgi:hypothetical protein
MKLQKLVKEITLSHLEIPVKIATKNGLRPASVWVTDDIDGVQTGDGLPLCLNFEGTQYSVPSSVSQAALLVPNHVVIV